MKHVRILHLAALALLLVSVQLPAQEHNYRSPGYKGSVSFTDAFLIWVGLDTSHGYMFNEHHYLGAGAGFYMVPADMYPTIIHVYAHYQAYWFKRKSTPVAGIHLGYARPVHPSDTEISAFEAEPAIGWSWGLNSGQGLTLMLGARILTVPIRINEQQTATLSVLPALSFAFEF